MQDINLLFGVLSDLCGLPDDVDVRGYVWLHDIDDDTIDAHIETAYGDDNCLTGIRFVCDKPPASGVEIIAEFDLTRRRVHFGCWRWS
jgi:hypothetical protein